MGWNQLLFMKTSLMFTLLYLINPRVSLVMKAFISLYTKAIPSLPVLINFINR
jgi:hypothetical protein